MSRRPDAIPQQLRGSVTFSSEAAIDDGVIGWLRSRIMVMVGNKETTRGVVRRTSQSRRDAFEKQGSEVHCLYELLCEYAVVQL